MYSFFANSHLSTLLIRTILREILEFLRRTLAFWNKILKYELGLEYGTVVVFTEQAMSRTICVQVRWIAKCVSSSLKLCCAQIEKLCIPLQ